jgi:release factor glutamine methyltransferase
VTSVLAERLRAVAGEDAALEARLLTEAAKGDAAWLDRAIARRLAREPVDRIIGQRGFWTLELKVTPATLSPRADTETVVSLARDRMKTRLHEPLRILDIGTGTGAILLALLAEFPNATGLGRDISLEALDVARQNATLNGLATRARFEQASWLDNLSATYDLIVSNPPYIPTADIAKLDAEVRDHDPHLALDGGADGLAPYRAIFKDLGPRLTDHGMAVLECGQGQAADVASLALQNSLQMLEIRKDFGGIERAIALARSNAHQKQIKS